MTNIKFILIIGIILASSSYEHYRLVKFEKEYTEYKKQVEMQNTIYKNELEKLSNQIKDQNNQINSLKIYTNENDKNSSDISNLKQEYNNIKPTSENITNYQNKLFDDFRR